MSSTVLPRPGIQAVQTLVVTLTTPKRLDQRELGVIQSDIVDKLFNETRVSVTQPTAPLDEINVETTAVALQEEQITEICNIIEKNQSRPRSWMVVAEIRRRSMGSR